MENNKDILPIFYSHSSQKSILTWWDEGKKDEKTGKDPKEAATSIITLAKQGGLKQVFFVSKNFHDFCEALKACEKNGLQLCFGLELWVTDKIEKTDQSIFNESKIIVWGTNPQSYQDLIRLYSKVYTNPDNKYYHFRTSWSEVKSMWTSNLKLTLPFCDSFIHKNLLRYGAAIIPELPCSPIIQREVNTGLPFERLINNALDAYNVEKECEEIRTKTIMYENYEDIKAYIVYRAIGTKGNYGSPNLDFMCSNTFCWEDYKEVVK